MSSQSQMDVINGLCKMINLLYSILTVETEKGAKNNTQN